MFALPGLCALFLCPRHSPFLCQKLTTPQAPSRDQGKCGGEPRSLLPDPGHKDTSYSASNWIQRITPAISALGRQRQTDLCEFKANQVYRASSRTARIVTQRNPVVKNKQKKLNSEGLAVHAFNLSIPKAEGKTGRSL